METILISNFNDLLKYSEKIPNDLQWFSNNCFEFEKDIQGIKLHLTGENFHSSMSTTLMRAILNLQEGIYKQYSLYRYGCVQKLTNEEKSSLEIYAKVNEGSSWIELIPQTIVQAIGDKFKDMTGSQMLIGIAIVTFATTVCMVTKNVINHREKIKKKEIEAETLKGIQKQSVEAQIEAIKATAGFYKEIAKQDKVETVEINGEIVTNSQLKNITSSERHKSSKRNEIIDLECMVTDIHFEDNTVNIDIITKDGLSHKNIQVLEGLLDQNDYQILKDSLNRKFMKMSINVNYKDDKWDFAILDSIIK